MAAPPAGGRWWRCAVGRPSGAQVLFGFLLAIRFTSPFSDLNAVQRSVYYATLLSTAVALVLLLAPGPRQSRDSSPFVR